MKHIFKNKDFDCILEHDYNEMVFTVSRINKELIGKGTIFTSPKGYLMSINNIEIAFEYGLYLPGEKDCERLPVSDSCKYSKTKFDNYTKMLYEYGTSFPYNKNKKSPLPSWW